ncbi:hypothetical protein [Ornithinibacillus scapharcae]|uniref:hypothetical protein n=1 Tax=Ornithinibacillus scapharcae TaxID=1147159 RepID=UPI000225AD7E|nr:hypothetical protein [Ornithinibacillus scapharcae]
MDIIRVEWVSFQEIKAKHTTINPVTRNSYHKYTETNIPYIHVIRNADGELFLHKGIEAYNMLKTAKRNIMIPVYITNHPTLSDLDWTYYVFQSCLREKVNHRLKYEYAALLLQHTNNNIQLICHRVGCNKHDIYKLIFEPTIPEKYMDLAIKYNRRKLINQVARNSKLQHYRSVLYPALFQRKNQLTVEKLKIFQTYLEFGYDFNVNSILALQNFNQIVDHEEALKSYWDHLLFPDTSIVEGVFYYKGDKNSRINVRL